MRKLYVIVYVALFISIDVILTRFLGIKTDLIRISLGFIPVALCSMLFGPIIGGISAMLGDVIGAFLVPQGAFFPGFTLSAVIVGVLYGVFLYNKPKTFIRYLLAVLCISIINDVFLVTYWLTILWHSPFMVVLTTRVLKIIVMFALQITIVPLLWSRIGTIVQNNTKIKVLQSN